MVAAVATVRPVPLALELGGRDGLVPDADRERGTEKEGQSAKRESTPPENATTQLPSERILASS